MISYEVVDGGVRVTSETGTWFAKRLVLTVGAWAPSIYGRDLGASFPLKVVRRCLFWFKPKEGAGNRFDDIPVYIYDMGSRGNFYGFPSQHGPPGGVKVAFHYDDPAVSTECTPDSINRTIAPAEVEAIREVLKSRMPLLAGTFFFFEIMIYRQLFHMTVILSIFEYAGLTRLHFFLSLIFLEYTSLYLSLSLFVGELIGATTCMYTKTHDEHFLIDFHPHSDRVILASPCSGHGYKFCSVIGEVLADLSTAGETKHDISLFKLGASRLLAH